MPFWTVPGGTWVGVSAGLRAPLPASAAYNPSLPDFTRDRLHVSSFQSQAHELLSVRQCGEVSPSIRPLRVPARYLRVLACLKNGLAY
jgi:hypothetical protein